MSAYVLESIVTIATSFAPSSSVYVAPSNIADIGDAEKQLLSVNARLQLSVKTTASLPAIVVSYAPPVAGNPTWANPATNTFSTESIAIP